MSRMSAEDRKSQIVDITLELLWSTSVEQLSTTVIAQKAGITQAAIFRHFPSKDDLWFEVLNIVSTRAQERWQAARDGVSDPAQRIRQVIDAQLKLITEYPAIPALIFHAGKFAAEDRLRPVHLGLMRAMRALLQSELLLLQMRGALVSEVSVSDCSDLVLGLVQGLVLRWILSDRSFDLRAEGQRLIDIQLALLAQPKEGKNP